MRDRLETLERVRAAGVKVCCGGIVGMGETRADRIGLLHTLATLAPQPESVPINELVPIPGTPLAAAAPLDPFEFVRCIAVARILMPRSHVRLSAGRSDFSDELQALCFFAGANSIFYGEKLLTTGNPDTAADQRLFERLGLAPEDAGRDARGRATQARAGMPEVEQRREQLPGAVAEGSPRCRGVSLAPIVSLSLDDALPEKRAARRAFDRAREFDACVLHSRRGARAAARAARPRAADARRSSSISAAHGARRERARCALSRPRRVLAVDSSSGMLRRAAANARELRRRARRRCRSACRCAQHCAELVLANLVLPWCRPDRAVRAKPRGCSTEGGAVLFATLGPGLAAGSAGGVRGRRRPLIHVHAAFDMHDLGDLALAAGLAEPVLDVDRVEVTYRRRWRAGPRSARHGRP